MKPLRSQPCAQMYKCQPRVPIALQITKGHSLIIIIIIIIIYLVFQRSTRLDIKFVNRLQKTWYKVSVDNKIHIRTICDYDT